jgi:hypothetical protein
VGKRLRIDEQALRAAVQKTLQAAFDENAFGLQQKGQDLLDAVLAGHAGAAPDTVEAELYRRYREASGADAHPGSFRGAADVIARRERAAFCVRVAGPGSDPHQPSAP